MNPKPSLLIGLWAALFLTPLPAAAQPTPTADDVTAEVTASAAGDDTDVTVADAIEIDPVNSDESIAERLTEILHATEWFIDPTVRVDRGVAFLSGQADTVKHAEWAEATAIATTDVVAVVNNIDTAAKPLWNIDPALASLRQIGRETTSLLPLIAVAIVIIILFYYLARLAAWLTRRVVTTRIDSVLLQQVAGNVVGVLLFIVGVYIALRVSGLTRLAVTLLGGTGLVGLALGFAFRDIAENYLASILISLNHPFRVDDLIEVDGSKGFVRKVTTRGTILNTLEGNQIQLPNSTVYKGKITNYTATPLRRMDFGVGIGFEDSIQTAQRLVMEVLTDHRAVATEPPPMVLVQSLGSATVNLRCYFWFDQTVNSPLKVSSSVIRMVKQVLTTAGITMPDEARELIFPQGVPVQMMETIPANQSPSTANSSPEPPTEKPGVEPEIAIGEGNLTNERQEVAQVTATDPLANQEQSLI